MGANVLIRLGKRRNKFLEGLVLFNTDNQAAGWLEWTRNLVNIKSLSSTNLVSETVVDYLITYHFGSGGNGFLQDFPWKSCLQFVLQPARDGPD